MLSLSPLLLNRGDYSMKFLSWLTKYTEELFLSLSLISLVFIMGLQVFMRYVMNNSLAWPEELSRYIFIWFAFIGVSYAIRINAHLRIDILFNYVSERVRKLVETISDLFFLGFSVTVLIAGIHVFKSLLGTMQTSPGLDLPMAFVYLSLPVGFGLTIIRLIQNIVNRYRGKEAEREEPII